jgi:hypothetical protein
VNNLGELLLNIYIVDETIVRGCGTEIALLRRYLMRRRRVWRQMGQWRQMMSMWQG